MSNDRVTITLPAIPAGAGVCDGCGDILPIDQLTDVELPPVASGLAFCDDCLMPPEDAPVDVLPCPRCQQLAAPGDGTVCQTCRTGERAAQGTAMHLFTPAPTVPAGSMTMF